MSEPGLPGTQDHPDARRAGFRWAILGFLALGIAWRLHAVLSPPTPPMLWDHHEYVSWGRLMDQAGFTALYDQEPPLGQMWSPVRQNRFQPQSEKRHHCNYPPGIAYVLYPKIRLLALVDPTEASNTPAARLIFAGLPLICDILLAFGCLALVRPYGHKPAIVAFAAAILAPPFVIDSCHWGQTDSMILAPAVWMIWAMQRQRWMTAGILWGAALALKTQGILLAPLWLLAFILEPRRTRVVAGGGVAAFVLLAVALPFTLHSGLQWFIRGFWTNLTEFYQQTTLLAFNIWYADLLVCETNDATLTWLGVSKDTWGKVFLLVGLAVTTALLWSRRQRHPTLMIRFAAVLLLLAVMLPTRVHERYIVLPLPFLICVAAVCPRTWWGVAPLLLAATCQITAPDWLTMRATQWYYHEHRILADIEKQYAALREEMERGNLTPEQFAALPTPREQLAIDHENHRKQRWATGDPIREWALTLLSLSSTLVCLIFVIPGCRARPPSAQPR